MEELLTIRQAAEELGIHRQTVYQAIRRGNLPAVEVLDRVAVRRADVEDYKERQARVGPHGGRPRKERRSVGRPRTRPEESGPKRSVGRPRTRPVPEGPVRPVGRPRKQQDPEEEAA